MTNPIVSKAVALTNEQRQEQVTKEGAHLINLITGELACIAGHQIEIKENQDQLQAIADGSITIEKIMGDVRLPSDGNANTTTILKAIEAANKQAQDEINSESTNLIADITGLQKQVSESNKRISEYRDKLTKLAAASVTEASVMS